MTPSPARPGAAVPGERPPRSASARRHVLGLRPRVFAALLLSSAVTLAVAALALLSPLEQRLRADGERAVFAAIAASRPQFSDIATDPATRSPDRAELLATVALLRRRSGAQVTVLNNRLEPLYAPAGQDFNVPDYYAQARQALRTGRGVHTLVGDQLVAAEPMPIGEKGATYAVVVTRRLQYVRSAVTVVQKAFIVAAAAGFGIALLLGLALTTTLLRRLERLRDAAGRLEQRGAEEEPIAGDERHDEIGDLTRAFAAMQERLRRQEQARHAFVATASHELRTPIASLDGTLELLEDDLDPQRVDLDDARERTARAREQSRRLASLATDLLDLSRLDAEVDLRAEPVELGELCRAVAAEFEQRAGEREIAIRTHPSAGTHPSSAGPHPSAGPCWAQGDPGAIARIVRILLDNAVKIAPERSTVDVSQRGAGPCVELLVADSGPGVPEDERERIFERFERGSTAGARGGFGLGLAIGRELATRMHGSLTLEPRSVPAAEPFTREQRVPALGEQVPVQSPPPEQSPIGERPSPTGACFVLRLPAARMQEDHSS